MTKQEMVHVAFRSKETGRYLFWVKWTKEEWSAIEEAARYTDCTIEEFIQDAIKRYLDKIF